MLVLRLTLLTIWLVLVFANIKPFPPATTSFELDGLGDILVRLRVGSLVSDSAPTGVAHLTLHLTAPPRRRPPTPPSVKVHTSRSVTLISLTLMFAPWPMYPATDFALCAGNCTFRERPSGEHSEVTRPEEEPTQSKSENGSMVRAVGIGVASMTVDGRGRSCKGVYVPMREKVED